VIAFNLLGLIGFAGLLRDLEFDASYLWSTLHVMLTLTLFYGIVTALFAFFDRTLIRRER
jgi:hypothetical protein